MQKSLLWGDVAALGRRPITVHDPAPNDTESPGADDSSQAAPMPRPEVLSELVVRIQREDESAKQQLYQIFNRGIRFQLVRQLGTADLDDKVHDTFVIVLQAIVNGDLREPEKLLSYIQTVVRRQIATYIETAMFVRKEALGESEFDFRDPHRTPEDSMLLTEERRVMRETLSELGPRDREILIRFYIDELSQEEICEEMGLSVNQFRLLKSRAKARFSELGKRNLRPKVLAWYHTAAGQ